MYQIDNASAASVRPAASSAGTAGWFTDGNPGTSTPATIFPAEFANMLMAEILSVLTAGGITPSKSNSAQLLAAIRTAGVSDAGSSFGSPGYQKLPSGLILQFGTVNTSASADITVTFPISFTTNAWFSFATPNVNSAGAFANAFNPTLTNVGLAAWTNNTTRAAITISWLVIGK